MKTKLSLIICSFFVISGQLIAQEKQEDKKRDPGHYNENKFRQMYDLLATPNMFRTASGAPGPAYYQQQADYKMNIELDDKNAKLYGTETITYTNNSPEALEYLWIQLDQNMRSRTSQTPLVGNEKISPALTEEKFAKQFMENGFDGGFNLEYVKDAKGNPMKYTINHTMMRIDLDKPLKNKQKVTFSIKWWYNVNNYRIDGGRSGYEQFEDGNRFSTV